ncbi:MAG: DUF3368 domain-containing protein [Chitinophagales bacterium]|nr:DUF3368 domain-containing protein [Chitinophagales bacterium]
MPKIVVSNTTPILSLLKIDKLELLKHLYQSLTIPYAVYEEIEFGKEKIYYKDLSKIEWINIKKIKDKNSLNYFIDLDKGEAEVLILSKEINADLVIIDEIIGRRYAKLMELNLTGTLGILLKAKSLGLISSVKSLILELENKGNWFDKNLISKVLNIANEA